MEAKGTPLSFVGARDMAIRKMLDPRFRKGQIVDNLEVLVQGGIFTDLYVRRVKVKERSLCAEVRSLLCDWLLVVSLYCMWMLVAVLHFVVFMIWACFTKGVLM